MCGVAIHLQALLRRDLAAGLALLLFVLVGLIHGYALGESIYGAERTPLNAYLLGLAAIQSAIAVAAMAAARAFAHSDAVKLRLVGAGVAGIGLAVLVQQIIPAPSG